jgi:Arc/MetJ-type ribon-helix-helix transcriptional regulator
MSTELSPDKDRLIEQFVAEGQFPSRRHALDRAVELLREELEAVADIRAGLASMERGEGTPIADLERQMREELGIPEDE